MKTLKINATKIVLGGVFALALLPLLSAFSHRSNVSANLPVVTQIADGTETHGGKPPKGA